ncbi:hypothetical protein CRI94_14050 [Longibacter salinarum]|uniref:Soluble ligand binding domain-containing protein n=1 Tax=Longibacter salinarum TaxID=1850348 RepID=A0A2A8CVJ5_9BACT|nr:hypothetical protein [Longibacter salinarum]PEN12633.1 hypothetical protein CRI94_14050 [Longibacter salinarum]
MSVLRPTAVSGMTATRSCEFWAWVLLFACLLSTADASAQRFGRIEDTQSNVAYFYHAQPGEATVQVSVWGTIPRPGIYEVSDSTDLDKLLTMAGGAPVEPRQAKRDPATITVRVYRPNSTTGTSPESDRTLQFEAKLDEMLNGSVVYPTLRDDDIIVVETILPRQRFTWRDAISVLSSAGTLTLLALRIFGRR